MYVAPIIRTSLGPRLIAPTPLVRVSLTRDELHTLIRAVERHADQAERDGCVAAAGRLARRAAVLRGLVR